MNSPLKIIFLSAGDIYEAKQATGSGQIAANEKMY
jgi:hypothetical protein